MISSFSAGALEALKYYVYILVDPRSNEIFYVGKGTDNRVFQHESYHNSQAKWRIISEIKKDGFNVERYIVHFGLTEREAFAVETALLKLIKMMNEFTCGDLENIDEGHNWLGPICTVDEFDSMFSGESLCIQDFDPHDRISLINLKTSNKSILTDSEWIKRWRRYNSNTDDEAKLPLHLLAVSRGIIIGAYDPIKWELIDPKIKRGKIHFICIAVQENHDLYQRYKRKNVASIMAVTSRKSQIDLF